MTPAECQTRGDIRREIDRLDRALLALLGDRFGYVRRMSEIKQDPDEARVDSRVKDVTEKVQALAREQGLDEQLIADMWTLLMDWNIEWERRAISARARRGTD